jgi:hypothetical protein
MFVIVSIIFINYIWIRFKTEMNRFPCLLSHGSQLCGDSTNPLAVLFAIHFQAIVRSLFLVVIPLVSWSSDTLGMATSQLLISGDFCDSVLDCLLSQSVWLTFQCLKEAKQLESPIKVSVNCTTAFWQLCGCCKVNWPFWCWEQHRIGQST